MSAAFSAIVNGGQYHTPTVLAGVVKTDGTYAPQPVGAAETAVSRSAADQVREMTHVARNTLYGRNDIPGYEVGGKTGTSQTLIDGNYNNNQTVGTYLGYGGDSTPRYVIMVQVSGKNMALAGGRDAGPIFTDLSNWMINYLKLQPKG